MFSLNLIRASTLRQGPFLLKMDQPRRSTRSSSKIHVASQVYVQVAKVSTSQSRPSKRLKRNEESNVDEIPESQGTQILVDQEDETHLETQEPSARRQGKRKTTSAVPDRSLFIPRLEIPWKIGAHTSTAGGVENSVVNAATIGANAFALFLKSQRKWTSPPLTENSITEFRKNMKEYGYESRHVIPHGSYLINLGNPDLQKRDKSYECFLDDLKRCEALGLKLYNFHPGSTVGGATLEESIGFIAECINRAHTETRSVTIVLENMAGAGNIIGGDFAHLAKIIEKVEDKSRVGVCFDTCHAFAAGYDIRTKEEWNSTMKSFDDTIGLSYLRAFHLNDSMCGLSSRKDRHQNIGQGELGLLAFRHIVTDERTKDIPMVLETPSFEMPKEVWGLEINALGRLSLRSIQAGGSSDADEQADKNAAGINVLTGEIKVAVKAAEAKNGKSKSRKLTAKAASGSKKRKRQAQQEEASSDEGGGSACEHD